MKPSEDDLLLLSVVLTPVQITDELEGYRNSQSVMVPLGELSRLLEIAIRVDLKHGAAEGFVGRTDRIFTLDVVSRHIRFAGKELPFDPDFVRVQQNDIFVDVRALNAWFNLGIVFDPRGSGILVNPKDPLPLQRRLQREAFADQLGSTPRGGYRDPGFARVPNPYQVFGDPAIDQSFTFNDSDALGAKNVAARYTAQIASDFEGGGLNGFMAFESNATPVARFSFGQKDPNGGLLGMLHAQEETFGDVQSLEVPLVSSAHPTTGMTVSNVPLSQGGPAETTTLTGPLQKGWDVELYRGEALIGYQQDLGNGKYEFKNIPLSLGTNKFMLEFNGPLGERREETVSKNIVGTLAPGELQYSMFIGGNSGAPEWTAQSDFGIKRDLTAFSSLSSQTLEDGSHVYSTIGMRGYISGALVSARIVDDPATGSASQLGGEWKLGQASVHLSQTMIEGLTSNVYGSQLNTDKSNTELKLGNLALPSWSHLLPADLELSREETTLGTLEYVAQGRLSYQKSGFGITNISSWGSQTGTQDQRGGEIMVTRFKNGNSLEGNVNYLWLNGPSISSLAIQSTRVLHDLRTLTMGVYESPQGGDLGVTATLNRNAGSYAYGLSLDVSKLRGINLGLSISFGSVKNPATGKWQTSAESVASRGAVLIHCFLDTNGNGKFEHGKAPVAGVAVFVNDSAFPQVTGPDGTLLVDGLAANRPVDIRISESTLEDPLLMSEIPGLRIDPRPGRIQRIEMPIVATGEVSGTVSIQDENGAHPAAGVLVEVLSANGKVLQMQATAFDGYYTLSRVPVGSQTVRVTAYGWTATKKIVVPPKGAFLDGIDLLVAPPSFENPPKNPPLHS